MLSSAFDLGEEIHLKTLGYRLHHPLWVRYDLSAIDLSFNNWTRLKYLNDDATNFHDDIDLVPDDRGGLYMFYVKCPVIKGITEYPFYIGRAQLTQGQNLKKRVKEYFSKFRVENERPKITKMFKYWDTELHLAFLVLDENEEIVDFEKKLINSLLLPMNDQIPDKETRDAVKAF
jgi:excinuclease UvrABC nuclease subunit